jgi:hypothetical protein
MKKKKFKLKKVFMSGETGLYFRTEVRTGLLSCKFSLNKNGSCLAQVNVYLILNRWLHLSPKFVIWHLRVCFCVTTVFFLNVIFSIFLNSFFKQ